MCDYSKYGFMAIGEETFLNSLTADVSHGNQYNCSMIIMRCNVMWKLHANVLLLGARKESNKPKKAATKEPKGITKIILHPTCNKYCDLIIYPS